MKHDEVKRYLVIKEIDGPMYGAIVSRHNVEGEDEAIYDVKMAGPFMNASAAAKYLGGDYETVSAISVATGKDLAIKIRL